MPWGVVAAGVAVAGSVYTSKKASDASDKASNRALAAARSSEQGQNQAYMDAEGRLSPFMATELAANKQLAYELGLSPDFSGQTQDVDALRAQLAELEANTPAKFKEEGFSAKAYFDPRGNQKYHSPTMAFMSRRKKKKAKKKAKKLREQFAQEKEQYESYIQQAEELNAQITAQEAEQANAGDRPPPGTAYMQNPGYQSAIDEGVSAVNQGSANQGSLYSGARGEALKTVGQNVQQNYYNNYMRMLQGAANPQSTTNLSNIGIGQAATIGATNINAANQASHYDLAGVEAENAATADIVGGLTSAFGAYMGRPQQQQYPGSDNASQPQNYSNWV